MRHGHHLLKPFVLTASVVGACIAGRPLAAQVVVSPGVRITVVTTSILSSKDARKGTRLPLAVAADVLLDGRVVVAKGAAVHGVVTESQSAGTFKRDGTLTFTVDSVQAVDGKWLPVVIDLRDTAATPVVPAAVAAAVPPAPVPAPVPPPATPAAPGTPTLPTPGGGSMKDQIANQFKTVVAGRMASRMSLLQISGVGLAAGLMQQGTNVTYRADMLFPVFTVSYAVVHPSDASAGVSALAGLTSGDSVASSGTVLPPVPAALAFYEAAHTWDRALAGLAAHVSHTPEVRDFGLRVLADDRLLQARGRVLAMQSGGMLPPLDSVAQGKLNTVLAAMRGLPQADFDQTILQQLYDLENGFANRVDPADTTPLGRLSNEAVVVWRAHIASATLLLAPPTVAH